MTAEIPKPASSKSASLQAALAFLGFGVVSLLLTLTLSITSAEKRNLNRTSYDNPFSRQELSISPTTTLAVLEPEKKVSLTGDILLSWQNKKAATREPRAESSLLQYFYAQTGTAHPWASYDARSPVKSFAFNEETLGDWVLQEASRLNRQPQNAELIIENGRAVKFRGHLDGYVLAARTASLALKTAWLAGQDEWQLPLETRSPKIRLSDLNNLGIKERIAVGQTDFSGSSAARINNIRVGASQYNGIILASGEEFSFNKYLGPVDAEHGFRPELVIKPEGATPEFGGGLCQVSTTAFRAAFFAGLPITARRNHSYAVKYYEWIADDLPRAVGLDATIYAPYQDLKFVNDLPSSLLIWTRLEGKRLYFDFYGTSDDREVLVDGPHPFDRKPSGAVKSTISRKVIKNGGSEEITFNSTYIPPKIAEQSFELPAPPPPTSINESPQP